MWHEDMADRELWWRSFLLRPQAHWAKRPLSAGRGGFLGVKKNRGLCGILCKNCDRATTSTDRDYERSFADRTVSYLSVSGRNEKLVGCMLAETSALAKPAKNRRFDLKIVTPPQSLHSRLEISKIETKLKDQRVWFLSSSLYLGLYRSRGPPVACS